mmetsp:Transcript_4101/g.7258  ORF Transcript_4101/g.7258 Transcript_4101/m.7258 type:complete len:212 (+) Transcript_4101:247-882(+)
MTPAQRSTSTSTSTGPQHSNNTGPPAQCDSTAPAQGHSTTPAPEHNTSAVTQHSISAAPAPAQGHSTATAQHRHRATARTPARYHQRGASVSSTMQRCSTLPQRVGPQGGATPYRRDGGRDTPPWDQHHSTASLRGSRDDNRDEQTPAIHSGRSPASPSETTGPAAPQATREACTTTTPPRERSGMNDASLPRPQALHPVLCHPLYGRAAA